MKIDGGSQWPLFLSNKAVSGRGISNNLARSWEGRSVRVTAIGSSLFGSLIGYRRSPSRSLEGESQRKPSLTTSLLLPPFFCFYFKYNTRSTCAIESLAMSCAISAAINRVSLKLTICNTILHFKSFVPRNYILKFLYKSVIFIKGFV